VDHESPRAREVVLEEKLVQGIGEGRAASSVLRGGRQIESSAPASAVDGHGAGHAARSGGEAVEHETAVTVDAPGPTGIEEEGPGRGRFTSHDLEANVFTLPS
jgi:hypothetical protein